jgi:chitinase
MNLCRRPLTGLSTGGELCIFSCMILPYDCSRDAWVGGQSGLPDLSRVRGYNVLFLSFLLLSGAADQALEWTLLDNTTRIASKSVFSNAGIKLMVSAFGSTDAPVSAGADAITTANSMAGWVQQWGLDGIDVDFEDFAAMDAGNGIAEQWLIDFTHTLRAALPAADYIITHAR